MTQNNLFQEVDEDLDRQKLEALWKKYGFWIITLAIGIVVWTASSTAYRSWRAQRAQQTTSAFLAASSVEASKGIESLQHFAQTHKSASLGALALLRAGALAADRGDKAGAIAIFDKIAADAEADPVFRQLGDLLSAHMQLDTDDAVALAARLQPLTAEGAPWRYSALEQEGYLALRTGDKAKARRLFTELSQDAQAPQGISARAADILRVLD